MNGGRCFTAAAYFSVFLLPSNGRCVHTNGDSVHSVIIFDRHISSGLGTFTLNKHWRRPTDSVQLTGCVGTIKKNLTWISEGMEFANRKSHWRLWADVRWPADVTTATQKTKCVQKLRAYKPRKIKWVVLSRDMLWCKSKLDVTVT